MRWSIIRLIWFRELRDQLRDRRTIFMVAVLPLVLYPLLSIGLLRLFPQAKDVVIGVSGWEQLPANAPLFEGQDVASRTHFFAESITASVLSPAGAPLGTLARTLAAAEIMQTDSLTLPVNAEEQQHILGRYLDDPEDSPRIKLVTVPEWQISSDEIARRRRQEPKKFKADGVQTLDALKVDAIVIMPNDFRNRFEETKPGTHIQLFYRDNDRAQLASDKTRTALLRWNELLKQIQFSRHGWNPHADRIIEIRTSAGDASAAGDEDRSPSRKAKDSIFELAIKFLPFVLVMWSLTGALHPAVDICAGEKERGTMETLLISPASREEIVYGKFLTIWVFSAGTALLNLASMGLSAWQLGRELPHEVLRPVALLSCIVLALPLSAFFSAICLAVGAYARSSKEGQYYLMPLFLVTLPLILVTLPSDVKLSPFTSLVPVTGVALLMQELMAAASLDRVPWRYFLPVLAPIALYSWLALRWAVEQFKREEVLFREAERLDLGLWLQRLFREKEAFPSTGEALVCFALIIGLRWVSLSLGDEKFWMARSAIGPLAFVIAPTLFMAILLTTKPVQGLMLRVPTLRALGISLLLAFCLLPLLAEFMFQIVPQLKELSALFKQTHPLTDDQGVLRDAWWKYALVLVVLPAVAEELAFRGFILTGLRRRFRPWTAILLSSLLFALFPLNVFQFLPHFFLGILLGLLATRTGSLVPGMLFHMLYNAVVVFSLFFLSGGRMENGISLESAPGLRWLMEAVCLVPAGYLIWRLARQPALRVAEPIVEVANKVSSLQKIVP